VYSHGNGKYLTGFHAGKALESKDRELPQIDIAGTLFAADIDKLEFREIANGANRMPMLGVKEEMGFSHFFYDTRTKNHYAGQTNIPNGIPEHVRIILLPPLKDIDPFGFALRYGIKDNRNAQIQPQKVLIAFSKEREDVPVKRKSQRI